MHSKEVIKFCAHVCTVISASDHSILAPLFDTIANNAFQSYILLTTFSTCQFFLKKKKRKIKKSHKNLFPLKCSHSIFRTPAMTREIIVNIVNKFAIFMFISH